jgi:hypothetical protein
MPSDSAKLYGLGAAVAWLFEELGIRNDEELNKKFNAVKYKATDEYSEG